MSGPTSKARRLAAWVPYVAAACAYLAFHLVRGTGWRDWYFLRVGGALVLPPGSSAGVHTYASTPVLQVGPLSLLFTRGLAFLAPFHVRDAALAAGLVLLLVTLRAVERSARVGRPAGGGGELRVALTAGGMALALGWCDMVYVWGHLDDALALTGAALAWSAARRDRAWACGLWLGLAVGAKPIALLAFAVVLVLPSAIDRRRAGLVALGAAAVPYLPFLLGDPRTLGALARFHIDVTPGSVLHLVYSTTTPSPFWVRPAQLGLALAAGAVAVRRGRPELVLLLAAVARLGLDPGDFSYYTAELMLGALVVEAVRAPGARAWNVVGLRVLLPWLVLDFDTHLLGWPPAWQRLVVLAAVVVGCCRPPGLVTRAWTRARTRARLGLATP